MPKNIKNQMEPSKIKDELYDCDNPLITLNIPAQIQCEGSLSGKVTSNFTPVQGASVYLTSSLPDNISFVPNPVITNENGVYTSKITIKEATDGTVAIIMAATEICHEKISVSEFTSVGCPEKKNTVYVANFLSSSVTAINSKDNSVIATIPVQNNPMNVVITSDGKFVYVANLNSASVSVISVSANKVVATIKVEGGSQNLVITPDNKFVYVYNIDASTVSVIETSSNIVVKTIDVGKGTRGNTFRNIAITPDGRFVYVANSEDETVSAIQTSDNTVIATILMGAGPLSIASTPDSQFVYVVNCTPKNSVSVIRTSDQTIVGNVSLLLSHFQNLAITPDGSFAYVIGALNQVDVIQLSDNTLIKSITFSSIVTMLGIAISPSSKFAYVTGDTVPVPYQPGIVGVIDVSKNTVIKEIEITAGQPSYITVSADGDYVYVSSVDSVCVIQTSDNTVIATILGLEDAQEIVATP